MPLVSVVLVSVVLVLVLVPASGAGPGFETGALAPVPEVGCVALGAHYRALFGAEDGPLRGPCAKPNRPEDRAQDRRARDKALASPACRPGAETPVLLITGYQGIRGIHNSGRAAKQLAKNATHREALQIWAASPGSPADADHAGPAARDAVPGYPHRPSIRLTR